MRSLRTHNWASSPLSRGACLVLAAAITSTAAHSETRPPAPAELPKTEKPAAASAAVPVAVTKPSQCLQCHTFEAGFSHPIDVAPSMEVPKHLPLTSGRVTCTTCHTDSDHSDRGKPAKSISHPTAARTEAAALLRPIVAAESFCTQCHDSPLSLKKSSHAAVTDRAHLQTAPRTPVMASRVAQARLDDESRSCIACHDGTVASDAGMHKSSMSISSGAAQEHPVGVSYSRIGSNSSNSEVRLVNSARLDKRIRLFDQTVGCGSCHSVYSRQEQLLVMSNRESKLCLSCHIQ